MLRALRAPAIADELCRPSKARTCAVPQPYNQIAAFDGIGQNIAVTALGDRGGLIEQRTPARHDAFTANRIVCADPCGAPILGNSVSAVKRIVKAAPARVRRIKRIPGVRERHNELRSGNVGNLIVHIGCVNGKVADLRQKITYLAEKTFVLREVQRLADAVAVISVDARLERITNPEQLPIALSEVAHQIS